MAAAERGNGGSGCNAGTEGRDHATASCVMRIAPCVMRMLLGQGPRAGNGPRALTKWHNSVRSNKGIQDGIFCRPKPGPVLDSLDRLKGLGPKSNDDAARRFRTTRPCSGPGVVGAGTNGRQAGCLCFCVSSWFVSVSVTSKSTVQSLARPCCRDLCAHRERDKEASTVCIR